MSKRSRQATHLAVLLAENTGVRVDMVWKGSGIGACYGWHVTWCDGPTETTMRAHAAALAHRVPAVDIGVLCYDRGWTDLARVASVLTYLADHPENLRYADWTADRAFVISEYPECSPERVLSHARALLAHTGRNSSDAALCLIAEYGAEWLDLIARTTDGRVMANVVDLSAERARRRHHGGIARIRNGRSRAAEAFTTPMRRRP